MLGLYILVTTESNILKIIDLCEKMETKLEACCETKSEETVSTKKQKNGKNILIKMSMREMKIISLHLLNSFFLHKSIIFLSLFLYFYQTEV